MVRSKIISGKKYFYSGMGLSNQGKPKAKRFLEKEKKRGKIDGFRFGTHKAIPDGFIIWTRGAYMDTHGIWRKP